MIITKKQLLLMLIYGFSLLTMFNIQTMNTNILDDNSQESLIDREELNYLDEEIINENLENNNDLETIINENNELVNFNTKTNQEIELNWQIGVALNVTYGNFLSFPSNFALLSSFNSESQFYRISYAYTTSRALAYKVEIVRHDAKLYIPLHWEYTWDMLIDEETIFYDSGSGGDDSFCINFGTNSDDSEVKLYFRSGNSLGTDYKRENQFLAIEETTCEYFCEAGFERGFSDKWTNDPTFPVDNVEIETIIVSSGRYSLMLNDSDSLNDYYYLTLDQLGDADKITLPNGNYYIAFDYYFRSIVSGSVCIGYTNNNGEQTTDDLNPILERVHKAFFYIEIGEYNSYHYLRFFLNSFEGIFYFDNFRIYESKAKFVTTNLNEYTLDYQIISWDNILNPTVRTNITINLKIRHNQTLIQSWNFFTCEEGKFSIIYYGDIGFNELEIEIICLNSWFGFKSYEFFEDLTKINILAEDYSNTVISNNELKIEINDFYYHIIRFNILSAYDFNNINYLIYDIKCNETSTDLTDIYYHQFFTPSASLIYANNQQTSFLTSYSTKIINLDSNTYDYSNYQIVDLYCVQTSVITNRTYYINNLRFIQSQKSYFTSLDVENNKELFKDIENDECDFTENDDERFSGLVSETIENGYYYANIDSGVSDILEIDISGLNTLYYNYLSYNVKCNYSNSKIHISTYDGTWSHYASSYIYPTIEFSNIEVDMSSDSTWNNEGIVTKLRFYIYNASGVWDGSAYITFDYIRICHIDTLNLFKTDLYFYTTSENNTLQSYITSDSNLLNPNSQDLDINILNNSIGNHQLNYTIYNDLDKKDCYIPSQEYSYNYKVVNQTLLIMSYIDLLEIEIDTSFANVMSSLSSLSSQLNTNITSVITLINDLDDLLQANITLIFTYLELIYDDVDQTNNRMTTIYLDWIADWDNLISDVGYTKDSVDKLLTNMTTVINGLNSIGSEVSATFTMVYAIKNTLIPNLETHLDSIDSQLLNIVNLVNNIINNQNNFSLIIEDISDLSTQLNTNVTTILTAIGNLQSIQLENASTLANNILNLSNQLNINTTTLINAIINLDDNLANNFTLNFSYLTNLTSMLNNLDTNLANNFTTVLNILNNIYNNQDNFSLIITNINNLANQLNSNTSTILNSLATIQNIQLQNASLIANKLISLSNQLNTNVTQLLDVMYDLNITQFIDYNYYDFDYSLNFDQSFNETVREFNMTSPNIVNTENCFFVNIDIWNNYTGSDITIIWQNELGEIVYSEYLGKAIITNNSLLLSINALKFEGNYTITIMLTNEYLVAFSQNNILLEYNLSKANSDSNNFFALGSFLLILIVIIYLVYRFSKKF